MSWTNELYNVYEQVVGTKKAEGEDPLLPISHSTANAQIELTIDEEGEFVSASDVSEYAEEIIVPDTGKAKTGQYPAPYPLNESLRYIAGDFNDFISEKIKPNDRNHDDYMKQLSAWKESDNSHRAVEAIFLYLNKNTVVHDCIESGILSLDESTGKLNDKQFKISIDKCFVRFVVLYSENELETRTWKDKTLYESFIKYLNEKESEKQLCYATGKILKAHYTHPYQITKSVPRAKLISSDHDEASDFTYRGRFFNKEQALSVSYEFSQKMHNALKWLIKRQRQGISFDTLTLVTWQSSLEPVPEPTRSMLDLDDDEPEPAEYDPKKYFAERLQKLILGYKDSFNEGDKVMILGLDAATTGRLSISVYTELERSVFYTNLAKWHEQTAWRRFNGKKGRNEINSFGFYDIAVCAFGTEQGGRLECDKKVLKSIVLRLLPCTTDGKKLPMDIVYALFNKASQPLSYDQQGSHRRVVETACGMIRKAQLDSDNTRFYKGEIKMAYDPTNTDRNYLFGCLLAIADKAESDTYDKNEKRITNARRYWNAFSSRPYQTWKIIEERLEPYLEKKPHIMVRYTKHLNEIMAKMSPDDFSDNSGLTPMYLIGFHHYNALLWGNKSEDDTNDNETSEEV